MSGPDFVIAMNLGILIVLEKSRHRTWREHFGVIGGAARALTCGATCAGRTSGAGESWPERLDLPSTARPRVKASLAAPDRARVRLVSAVATTMRLILAQEAHAAALT